MTLKINGIIWTKTTRKHALGCRYSYFIQLSRSKRWFYSNPPARKLAEALAKTYGESARREAVIDPATGLTAYHRHIPNDNWFLDTARHRIYIAEEKTLTYMALMA